MHPFLFFVIFIVLLILVEFLLIFLSLTFPFFYFSATPLTGLAFIVWSFGVLLWIFIKLNNRLIGSTAGLLFKRSLIWFLFILILAQAYLVIEYVPSKKIRIIDQSGLPLKGVQVIATDDMVAGTYSGGSSIYESKSYITDYLGEITADPRFFFVRRVDTRMFTINDDSISKVESDGNRVYIFRNKVIPGIDIKFESKLMVQPVRYYYKATNTIRDGEPVTLLPRKKDTPVFTNYPIKY